MSKIFLNRKETTLMHNLDTSQQNTFLKEELESILVSITDLQNQIEQVKKSWTKTQYNLNASLQKWRKKVHSPITSFPHREDISVHNLFMHKTIIIENLPHDLDILTASEVVINEVMPLFTEYKFKTLYAYPTKKKTRWYLTMQKNIQNAELYDLVKDTDFMFEFEESNTNFEGGN